MLRRWIKRGAGVVVAAVLAVGAWDVATYDADAWLADYGRLKRDMAQGYANLDWMVAERGVDLAATDRETTAALEGAHSRVRAFLALRRFVEGFGDPHLRMKPGQRPVPTPAANATAGIESSTSPSRVDPPAGLDCAASGYEEDAHEFVFPFAQVGGWKELAGGSFPIAMLGDTGVLRIAQFGEDRYLAACESAFQPGLGKRELQLAVRGQLQGELRVAIARLRKEGARRLLVDVTGNGGGSEWVNEVIALMSDRALTRQQPRRVAPTCDRSGVWRGEPPACSVFGTEAPADATLDGSGEWTGPVLVLADNGTGSAAEDFVVWLQQNKVATVLGERTAGAGCGYINGGNPTRLAVVPVDVWMPNCARFLNNGRNEVEGISPDLPLPMGGSEAERARGLQRALATLAG